MDCTLEKECSALGGLFQSIINDLKNSHPVWDDFAQKATKLHVQLKATISTVNLFLDALQKIADVATAAKGATRDIGTALTRICMRHRSVENRLKTLCSALIDCLVQPLQEKIEDWRRTALQMDKDHAKEYKRCRHEIKKRSSDTVRLQKKLRKGQSNVQRMLESASQEVNDRYLGLLDIERQAVRQAMVEQRSQYCMFVSCFKPVMDGEISLLSEISQMTEVVDLLCKHSTDPFTLPASSEAVILDAKGLENTWRFQTPPSSPGSSSLGSRKSSFCSLSSSGSHESSSVAAFFHHQSTQNSCQNFQQQPQQMNLQAQKPQQRHLPAAPSTSKYAENNKNPMNLRFSSMSSQDSGFTSQDTLFKKPKTPPKSINLLTYTQPPTFNSDEEGSTPGSLDSSQQSTPSPSPSSATWPDGGPIGGPTVTRTSPVTPPLQRPHTISSVYADNRSTANCRRLPLNSMTFVPPRPTSLFKNSPNLQNIAENVNNLSSCNTVSSACGDMSLKSSHVTTPVAFSLLETPPGGGVEFHNQQQPIANDAILKMAPPPNIPNFNQTLPNQILVQPIYMNVADLHKTAAGPLSPNLIVGGGPSSLVENQLTIKTSGPRPSRRPLSFVGSADDFRLLLNTDNGGHVTVTSSSSTTNSCQSRDDDEDTVIGDCVEQIDMLTSELDRYCELSRNLTTLARQKIDNTNFDNVKNKHRELDIAKNQPEMVSLKSQLEMIPFKNDLHLMSYCTLPRRLSASKKASFCGPINGDFLTPVGTQMTNTIVRRPPAGAAAKPPPPPVRRNSAITAATPNAPAIDVVRSNSRCTTPIEDNPCYSNTSALVQPMIQTNASNCAVPRRAPQNTIATYSGPYFGQFGAGNGPTATPISANMAPISTLMTPILTSVAPNMTSTAPSFGHPGPNLAHPPPPPALSNFLAPNGRARSEIPNSPPVSSNSAIYSDPTLISHNHREVMLMQIRRGVRLRSTTENRNRSLPRV